MPGRSQPGNLLAEMAEWTEPWPTTTKRSAWPGTLPVPTTTATCWPAGAKDHKALADYSKSIELAPEFHPGRFDLPAVLDMEQGDDEARSPTRPQ